MSWPSDKVLKAPVTEASQRSATEHAHQEVATTAAPKHSSAVAADHSSMPKQGGAPSVATEHSGASQVVSEHSGASQVATEHNVTDQGTSDVNDTEYDDGPIRPCAICETELLDDPPPRECRACSRETCYDCLGRCYQPGCHQRFCGHCLRDHAMRCLGRGGFTFRLRWPSGQCIQRLENTGDLSVEQLIQHMEEGLIQGLPRAGTTSEGEWLQSYRIVHGTNVMQDGTFLSDYDLPHDASLTVVLVELARESEHGATEHTSA